MDKHRYFFLWKRRLMSIFWNKFLYWCYELLVFFPKSVWLEICFTSSQVVVIWRRLTPKKNSESLAKLQKIYKPRWFSFHTWWKHKALNKESLSRIKYWSNFASLKSFFGKLRSLNLYVKTILIYLLLTSQNHLISKLKQYKTT